MKTRTGHFPIGFRTGGSPWQKDIARLSNWAKQHQFAALDLNAASPAEISTVTSAGLQIGSIDLLEMGNITDPDPAKRRELLAANLSHINLASAAGAKIFFTIVGGDPAKQRGENYRLAVESFAPLAEAAHAAGATLAVEGYPGRAPHYSLLCTTPETCRAILKEIPRGLAINYDPSHLIRLGVDHIRFLKEFADRVVHVHGKDTQLFHDAVYEFGLYQPSAFDAPHAFGQHTWRYTIPGHGIAEWSEIFNLLSAVNYRGVISIELEDENFNGSEEGEKAGLIHSRDFLTGV